MHRAAVPARARRGLLRPLPAMDLPFLILVLTLVGFGLVMLYSASSAVALYRRGDAWAYVRPQLLPQCPPGVPVPGGQLQPVEPGNKPCKADAAQKQRHQPGTGAERLLRQGTQGFGPGHGSTSFSGSVYAGRACGYD